MRSMLPGINVNICLSHEGVWYAEHYGWPDYMEGKYKQEQQIVILKSLSVQYLYSSYTKTLNNFISWSTLWHHP